MPTWADIFSDVPRGAGLFQFDLSDVAGELGVATGMFAGVGLRRQALQTPLVVLVAEWSQTAHTATPGLKQRGPLQRI